MLIARWLFLLAGLGACAAVALFFWTGNRVYLTLARRIFAVALGIGVLFFAILILERLVLL